VPEILRAKVKVFVELFRMTEQVKRQAEEKVTLVEERSKRTAAEDENARLQFLVRAGEVLGQSLDFQVTAQDVARVIVPDFADLAVIAQVEEKTGGWTFIHAENHARSVLFHEYKDLDRLPAHWATAIERSLVSGQPELLPGRIGGLDSEPETLVLPLRARGRTFGVLCFTREPSNRTFGEADVSVALAVASRAAIAMDNAQLYKDVETADRQKNEFLSMLAHELRNPLAPIRNAVAVLRHQADAESVHWAEDIIDRQVSNLVRMVEDLLDVSRITQGKIRLELERLSIAEAVASAVETSRPLIDSRRHHLQVRVPQEPVWITGDQARLAQVLGNLLNNAAKYTPDGGTIWITALREGENAVFRVRDTGIGIPGEMLARVFDLFAQVDNSLDRAQGGLGIGLTLVRRLVELHNGTVEVASAGPNQGSEFTIRIPALVSTRAANPARGPAALPAAGRGLRILVVDDNVDAANTLAELLRIKGHEVRVAYEGLSAVEGATSFRPQVAILDLGLPGLNGYEVAQRLEEELLDDAPLLIAVSGYGREEDLRRSSESGFDHHFVKPVEVATLLRVLAEVAPQRA
jgi:signal transduction histidine kinase/ActR/RegA family two-component response regulator